MIRSMRHLCQTAPICASMGNIRLVCVLVLASVSVFARGRKKEQKKGNARGNIASMHSLSIFLQASLNREDSLDAAGCEACH